MSLRTYFDSTVKKGAQNADDRRRALGVTIKKGNDASRHLQQAQDSLKKIQAKKDKLKQHA